MSAANDYLKKLAAELTGALGPDFKFFRSRCELQRKFAGGHHSVVLGGSTKWSPFLSVAFHFGVCFDEARKAEKALGYQPTYYQIMYYSPNGPAGWSTTGPARGT